VGDPPGPYARPTMGAPPSRPAESARPAPELCRFAVFSECPHCGGEMAPEHAHFRCRGCGWRDSCCD
jgi:hypothetical protein